MVYIGTNIDREAEKESVGSVLAQITTNRGVLTASTHNCQPTMPLLLHVVTTNHNQQNSRCVSTNHKRDFFYERTITNKRGVLTQITINKVQDVLA